MVTKKHPNDDDSYFKNGSSAIPGLDEKLDKDFARSRAAADKRMAEMKERQQKEAQPITRSELIELLKENLKFEVQNGHFTDPNKRELRLWFGEELITSVEIDIKERPEYEG